MIAAYLCPAHLAPMATKPESLLPNSTLAEMRPERIGERLRILREALGLSPAEMSDLLGIERTYWSRFERGNRPITETVAALLVERFGVTLDFLILGRWNNVPFEIAERMRSIPPAPPAAKNN